MLCIYINLAFHKQMRKLESYLLCLYKYRVSRVCIQKTGPENSPWNILFTQKFPLKKKDQVEIYWKIGLFFFQWISHCFNLISILFGSVFRNRVYFTPWFYLCWEWWLGEMDLFFLDYLFKLIFCCVFAHCNYFFIISLFFPYVLLHRVLFSLMAWSSLIVSG